MVFSLGEGGPVRLLSLFKQVSVRSVRYRGVGWSAFAYGGCRMPPGDFQEGRPCWSPFG